MSSLKRLTGRNASHAMHNNEDARVRVSIAPLQKDEQKGDGVKAKAVQAAKAVKRIPYYIWIWEKAGEAWGWFCEHAESIFELIS